MITLANDKPVERQKRLSNSSTNTNGAAQGGVICVQWQWQCHLTLLSVDVAVTYSCKFPLKASEEDNEGKREVTARLANAKEISVDAAVAAVLTELDGFFHIKRTNNSTGGFFSADNIFSLDSRLALARVWWKHCGLPWGYDAQLTLPLAPTVSLDL